MTIKILMPALSPTMTEGNLTKWHVKEGDEVNPGDVIAEIETDKATMEVESIDEGIVGKILVPEGTEAVQANATIGVLLEVDEDASAIGEEALPWAASAVNSPPGNADTKSSPLAKRIAEQTGVDLGLVTGSGAHGKVVKADVEAAISVGAERSGGQVDVVTDGPLQEALDADGNRIFASPLARRIAAQAGVSLAGVSGRGPDGRIVKSDVEAAIASAPG